MSPQTEIRQEGGYWSVYVNGQRTVDRESFAVADRVKFYLDHPSAWDHSESCDVADSIRRHIAVSADVCGACGGDGLGARKPGAPWDAHDATEGRGPCLRCNGTGVRS